VEEDIPRQFYTDAASFYAKFLWSGYGRCHRR
jgi:hypothetical protein